MPLKTDFNKIQSVYDRIIGDYSGREPGTRLPSCRAARLRYDCTRKELEMALAMLKQAGKISVFDRRGIFWNSGSDATYRVSIVRTDWPQEYSDTLEAIFAKHLNAHPDISFKRAIIPVEPKVEDYLNVLKSRTCDLAVITCNFTHFSQQDAGRLLNESPVPIIFLENHIVCRAINLIDSKPEFTGMLAADYLIRRGHRKIALVNAERFNRDTCLERELDGFISYLSLHEITPEIIDCRHPSQYSSLGSVEEKGRHYIENHGINFTAAFATSVDTARGFCSILKSCGCSIPEDVSIIANSEVPSAARMDPPLTTIARNFSGYARAAERMIEIIRKGGHPGIIRVPSYIVERQSVRDINKTEALLPEKNKKGE
ncbi:MAG: substrate-binding domain-containing protein [Lentisphaeria bacterium]|nr:substrate-binding domain-containing protein [Lentisphaeria bacterium]